MGAALLSGVLSIKSLFSVAELGVVIRMAPGGSEWARQQCVLGGFFVHAVSLQALQQSLGHRGFSGHLLSVP